MTSEARAFCSDFFLVLRSTAQTEPERNALATLLRCEQRRLGLRRRGGYGWSGLRGSVLFLGWLWLGLVLQEVVEGFIDGGEGGGTDLINPGG